MKFIIVLTIMLFNYFLVISQNRIDIYNYYKLINQAELNILDSSYSKADSLYGEAFKLRFPSSKDAYNSFRTAFIVRDTVQARFCFGYLLSHGLLREDLEKMPAMEVVTEDMFYIKDIAWDDEYYYWQHAISGQKSKACFFDSLYAVDQYFRKYPREAQKLSFNYDRANVESLIKKIKEIGAIPSSDDIGVCYMGNQSVTNEGAIFFLHWHTRFKELISDTTVDRFDSLLKAAVLEGKYDPLLYAVTIDQRANKYGTVITKDMLNEPHKIININKAREMIYLESIEDNNKKVRYSLLNVGQPFIFASKWWALVNQEFISNILGRDAKK